MRFNWIVLFVLILLLPLGQILTAVSSVKQNKHSSKNRDFIVLTIPKSGTHLLVKLLVLLTERNPYAIGRNPSLAKLELPEFEQRLLQQKKKNEFFYNHAAPFSAFCDSFLHAHPNYLTIVNIRDLRDLIISFIHHVNTDLEIEMGRSASLEDKLTWVLNPNLSSLGKSIEGHIIKGIAWTKRSNVLITRFEDLVGIPGGGDAHKQAQVITNLAKHIGVTLTADKTRQIQFNLFGNTKHPHVSGTFRKGQIGAWKNHYTQQHIELFKTYWGKYQIELGYPLDF